MMPVNTHVTRSHPGEPTVRAMSDETMKIPDPIIDPTTIVVESSRFNARLNSCCSVADIFTRGFFAGQP